MKAHSALPKLIPKVEYHTWMPFNKGTHYRLDQLITWLVDLVEEKGYPTNSAVFVTRTGDGTLRLRIEGADHFLLPDDEKELGE